MSIIVGVPANVLQLHQQGALERAFHDGLFPGLMYRAEAMAEQWQANTGEEMFQSRPGLLAPTTEPLTPGVDPVPQTLSWEQWIVKLDRYGSTIDTHIPTSVTANANLFMRHIHQLGLQAGQSLNQIPRNRMFRAYLSGQTVTTAAALNTDTTIKVAALNGFRDVVQPGSTVRPAAVSATTPLTIRIMNATPISASVVGTIPDDPSDPDGPGTLVLAAATGAAVAARTPVLSDYAPDVLRSGGGNSIDAISAADTLTLQDVINAVSMLRTHNVPPHDDGYYHVHVPPLGNAQFFADPAFQRLHTGMPAGLTYQKGYLGEIAESRIWNNNESPTRLNSGARTATGSKAFYSRGIGAETTNEAGVNILRAIVTGKGCVYEKYLDESQYVTEAGVTGKVGEFTLVNNGLQVLVDRVRLILRAPLNRMQDEVAASWSYTGDFPIPSDVTAGSGQQRYKRAVVIEFAG